MLRQETFTHSPFFRGLYGGAIGGIAFLLFLIALEGTLLRKIILPIRGLASIILGLPALTSDNSLGLIIATGIILPIVAGSILGIIFILIVGRLLTAHAANIGVLYGLVVWIVLQLFIIPSLVPFLIFVIPPYLLALSFAVYGLVLGSVYHVLSPVFIHYHTHRRY